MSDKIDKKQSRKWKAFVWIMTMQSSITIAAAVKMIMSNDASVITAITLFIAACFAAIQLSLAFYFFSNVWQKKVVGDSSTIIPQ